MVGNQPNAQTLESGKLLPFKHVNAVEALQPDTVRQVPAGRRAGLRFRHRRQGAGHEGEIEIPDRLSRQRPEPRAQYSDVPVLIRVIAGRQEDHKRLRKRINPQRGAGPAGVAVRAQREQLTPGTAVARVNVPTQPAPGLYGRRTLDAGHQLNGFRFQDTHAVQ